MSTSEPRILATTSRMPFAVDEIRKLGETGRDVTAVDTFKASPGSHSRGAARHSEVPAPAQNPSAFIAAVDELIDKHRINWLIPMFEEVFYLAAYREQFAGRAELFFPSFETLAQVHDKVTFSDLCESLGLPVAQSVTATSNAEIRQAVEKWDHWFARAAYGRGGLDVITNTGPLAGESSLDDIEPTPAEPWLVQEYLKGVDRCSWSVVHHGEVVLHSCYEHPLTIDDRGGIIFESVDSPESLHAAQTIARELNWHGQLSFDYLVTEDGVHHMVECNPRPTSGCTVATAAEFDAALFGPRPQAPVVVPAGRKRSIKVAVLRDALLHPSRARANLRAAHGASDVYGPKHDHLPLLYTALSLQHVLRYRKALGVDRNTREQLVASQFFDVSWNGAPIR